ncbi:multiple epidermal growth factor-like domains protein 10 [Ostrea edulis]|uniref:multiple epidermal growth factor-like domains protein 10 n=1 Tax=Ostrea edulis TaxID=37623 RepID=UPI0024AF1B7A|nr:multiple epidermal growth factor-like domains protein 10 [Ostrea edulis]
MDLVMSKIIVFALFNLLSACNCKCRSQNGDWKCCADFIWSNETRRCIECPVGYHGENCRAPCQYPNFGRLCQSECLCSNASCDPVTGCTSNRTRQDNQSECESQYRLIRTIIYLLVAVVLLCIFLGICKCYTKYGFKSDEETMEEIEGPVMEDLTYMTIEDNTKPCNLPKT